MACAEHEVSAQPRESHEEPGRLLPLLRAIVDVKPSELKAMVFAGLYFFILLGSYFILRPIRDEMAVTAGVSKLPWLFAGTLGAMILCNPLYSTLVARLRVKQFIGITYQFFVLNLVLFFVLWRTLSPAGQLWVGRVFFVWTSVYNLFVVSVFWSFMADNFRSEQGKRLFGFIGMGGTAGSICGSALTAALATRIGATQLLIVSAALLEVTFLIVLGFPRPSAVQPRVTASEPPSPIIGGSAWAGISRIAKSPYLIGICAFLLLYTLGSTFIYFEQTEVVGRYFSSRNARTEMLAKLEFGSQLLTVLIQFFLTGRLIRWIGLAATLAVMPTISVLGFTAMGLSALKATALLPSFVAFSILRRGTNFGLTNPGKEVLFTVVKREDKFKAKSFIDTFVYRAGDQIAAWTYAALSALGLGLSGIAWVAVPLSAIFIALSVWLGRKQEELAVVSRASPKDSTFDAVVASSGSE
jgi:ATP:ADP antiporter, AAA family